MDLRKFRRFLKQTEEDKRALEDQRLHEKKLEQASRELESQQSALLALIKSRGWKYIEEWKDHERDALFKRLYIEVRDRNFKKAEKTAADIEAINKLHAGIINMIGPQE